MAGADTSGAGQDPDENDPGATDPAGIGPGDTPEPDAVDPDADARVSVGSERTRSSAAGSRTAHPPRRGAGTGRTPAAGSATAEVTPSGSAPLGPAVGGVTKPGLTPLEQPGDRFRVLLGAALTTLALGLLAMVVVAAVAGLTADAAVSLGPLLAAAIPLWLAAHQVPLTVDGAPLGVLPLLPTVAMVWLVAKIAERATRRLGGRLREDFSPVVATLAGATASVAVLATAWPSGPVQATPWAALLGAGLVTSAGAVWGGLRVSGLPAWWSYSAVSMLDSASSSSVSMLDSASSSSVWLRTGLAAARTAAAALAAQGALLLVAALLVDIEGARSMLLAAGPGFGAMLGVTLLSLCYLPNALVASVGWALGPGLSIGAATASPLYAKPGPLPGLPVMAAMPSMHPPSWTVIVFALPALAGVLAGLRCRRLARVPANRVRAVAVAAVLVALGTSALAAVVSGRLATGPFDPVAISPLATGAAVLGWLGVPAAMVALLPSRGSRLR